MSDERSAAASLRGTPIGPSNVSSRTFLRAARSIGMDALGWHIFRHTCAFAILNDPEANGASAIKQAQEWLGHSTATVTMDIYWSILKRDLADPSMFDHLAADLVPDLVPGGGELAEAA